MNNLPKIIGKAPSEMTLLEVRTKLLAERERVRRGLSYMRTVKKSSRGKGRGKASQATKLNVLMKETGLSPQQLLKGLELLKVQAKEAEEAPEAPEEPLKMNQPKLPPKEKEINDRTK